jgi:hypothetical protein
MMMMLMITIKKEKKKMLMIMIEKNVAKKSKIKKISKHVLKHRYESVINK